MASTSSKLITWLHAKANIVKHSDCSSRKQPVSCKCRKLIQILESFVLMSDFRGFFCVNNPENGLFPLSISPSVIVQGQGDFCILNPKSNTEKTPKPHNLPMNCTQHTCSVCLRTCLRIERATFSERLKSTNARGLRIQFARLPPACPSCWSRPPTATAAAAVAAPQALMAPEVGGEQN